MCFYIVLIFLPLIFNIDCLPVKLFFFFYFLPSVSWNFCRAAPPQTAWHCVKPAYQSRHTWTLACILVTSLDFPLDLLTCNDTAATLISQSAWGTTQVLSRAAAALIKPSDRPPLMHFLFFNTSGFFLFSPPAGSCIPRSQGGGRGIAWMFMLCCMRIEWLVSVCVFMCARTRHTPPAPKGVRVCVWVRSCLVA